MHGISDGEAQKPSVCVGDTLRLVRIRWWRRIARVQIMYGVDIHGVEVWRCGW
jgi:hypothetical protein